MRNRTILESIAGGRSIKHIKKVNKECRNQIKEMDLVCVKLYGKNFPFP